MKDLLKKTFFTTKDYKKMVKNLIEVKDKLNKITDSNGMLLFSALPSDYEIHLPLIISDNPISI